MAFCAARTSLARTIRSCFLRGSALALVAAAALALALTCASAPAYADTYNGLEYHIDLFGAGNQGQGGVLCAIVTGYDGDPVELSIPAEIDEFQVAIVKDAFYGCTSLESVSFAGPVEGIGGWAFFGCTSLKSVSFQSSVKDIGENAFYNCFSLESVTFAGSVGSIDGSAFGYCSKLASFAVEDDCPYMTDGRSLIRKDDMVLISYANASGTSYTIPSNVTSIGELAFLACTSLESVTFAGSVGDIDGGAFQNCIALKSVCFQGSVGDISGDAFQRCTALKSISFGGTVGSISGSAFWNCPSLADVYFAGSESDKASIPISGNNTPLNQASWHCNHVHQAQDVQVIREATYVEPGMGTGTCECGLYMTEVVIPTLAKTPLDQCEVTLSAASYAYNGKAKKPTVTVKLGSKTLKSGTDYTVTYASGRTKVGTYKVTVKAKSGNMPISGTVTKSFKINPAKTSIVKKSGLSKSFKVTWKKKAKQVTGYQIRYKLSTAKTWKTVTVTKNTTVSKTVKNLKAKKKYYVQVRTYKTVNGTKYYSAWSAKKTVTTK